MTFQPIYRILVLVVLLLVNNQKWGWLRCKKCIWLYRKTFLTI